MESKYNFAAIEDKWNRRWSENPAEYPVNAYDPDKPTYYCLDMFPYPSAAGLHVGHWRGYVISDVISRKKLLEGHYVLHPMGWDAFGLPAENYAIKTGIHPVVTTAESVNNFKRQLNELCAIYDWSREVNTSDPDYYKWTQWIFVQMFKKGLAYEKEMLLNWCPECKVVLANEEAAGGICERCGSVSEKKYLRQWMLKITAYADRLLDGLDGVDWPQKVVKMQSDWIGKSYGAEITFKLKGLDQTITVFTTRPDTLYGATCMVLSPEHDIVDKITTPDQAGAVSQYKALAGSKSSVDRMSAKEKTGVFTGAYAINPINGELMPIWIADYVLIDYGTGAIMSVPGHDQRDFDFATKYGIEIIRVISKDPSDDGPLEEAYEGDGVMVNSGFLNGMKSREAINAMAEHLEKAGCGKKTINYKLRDWVFSRQRYWGEPIPIIHCPHCGAVPVPEKDLPVVLPYVESYKPTDTGESPLSRMEEWINVSCPVCGAPSKRETNTMPNWAGSSWYFLRYVDPKNDKELADPELIKKWLPIDFYIGGIEHAVLHLLYARFYTKFLHDIGVVDFDEPFKKLFNQGMLNLNGKKMSKSSGHFVSPDDIISRFGCDALRMYTLFYGPPEMDADWYDNGMEGMFRFLSKTWRLVAENKYTGTTKELLRARHKLIMDVSRRLESFSLNTVVSAFMEGVNKLSDLSRKNGVDKETIEALIILLAPFVPHIAAEMWEQTGHDTGIFDQRWPAYDESLTKEDNITIVIQINGKVRANIEMPADADKDAVLASAREAAASRLEGQTVKKEIVVPGKLVNFVV